ncbi:MAG: hypothetical protein KAQ74_06595, partial [Dehalococcoidia bacterium]|nr:hypothetical protein [Dehalococcoidia bacterium]
LLPGLNQIPQLDLADAENLGPTRRARALNRGTSILQSNLLGILDLDLLPTLHTIRCGHNTLLSTL